jgi:hypothetical protein
MEREGDETPERFLQRLAVVGRSEIANFLAARYVIY